MSIKNRPYAGSWQMGTQSVVRYTPDAKVLINGHEKLAVCATCDHQTDFNKYITTISCDSSTDPISTASLTLVMPRHKADVFSHDGNYVLHPGLEVIILMRGYFPVTGYAMLGQEEADGSEEEMPVYPYYQVFRGVVTEATHEFSGGFYTASLTCSSILHFWQYLYISTNGSVFGSETNNSGGGIDLTGHQFTGMTPYGIIYTLMRVGFGAAFGVNWTISQASNLGAIDESSGKSMYKNAALWWEKRWQEASTRLRLYGFDGGLFNAMEQAYLGLFDAKNTKAKSFLQSFGIDMPDDYDFNSAATRQQTARTFGWKGTETTGAILDEQGTKLDVTKMQAYTLDLGRLGSVNMFESEYMSKLEIANAVKDLTGFEFYQDVDGDIVFKPPFYNLDTSDDEVYCIRDRDLISISESEREPEATYVKGSGSLFTNFQNVLSGEFGTRQGKFADWRLIAQYGWREASFESHYYSGAKQMFIGAIMRLDVTNAEMRTAQITIPMRPELRPGYPVWIEHIDCFYYIKGLSHSFAPGSSAQTTITAIAKRAKFLPPGLPDRSEGAGSQTLPTLSDVRLNSPGDYPPMPLYVFPEDVEGSDAEEGSGPPRVMGYPNVVMALDPDKLTPKAFPGGLYFSTADSLFNVALSLGALRRIPDDPESYLVATSNDDATANTVSKQAVTRGFADYAAAIADPQNAAEFDDSSDFGKLVAAIESRTQNSIPDAAMLSNYMGLQRSLKNVFGSTKNKGEFRYFSSSAPDQSDQSPSQIVIDHEAGEVKKTPVGAPVDSAQQGITLLKQESATGRIKITSGLPTYGFRVYGFAPPEEGEKEGRSYYSDVTTRDIRFVTFQKITERVSVTISTTGESPLAMMVLPIPEMVELFTATINADATKGAATDEAGKRFGEGANASGYGKVYSAIAAYAQNLQVTTMDGYSNKGLEKFENSFKAFGVKRYRTVAATTEWVGKDSTGAACTPSVTVGALPAPPDTCEWVVVTTAATKEKYSVNLPKDTALPVGRNVDGPNLTGLGDRAGVYQLSQRSSKSLGGYLGSIQELWQGSWDGRADPTPEEIEAKAVFLSSLMAGTDNVAPSTTGGKTTFQTADYKETGQHSVVLPVSDNAGYEVYGTLAYGRGLNIRSYKGILEVGGSPTDSSSMLAVEKFFARTLKAGASVPKALGTMSAPEKAELAAGLGTTTAALQSTLEALKEQDDSAAIFVRNTPVTTAARGQSFTTNVSAAELASLTTGATTVCLCKGTEAGVWLQAFTGEFVELAGDEAVNDFLTDAAAVSGYDYKITKQALAGEVLDTQSGNKLGQMVKSVGESFTSLGTAAEDSFETARQEVVEARELIDTNKDEVDRLVREAQETERVMQGGDPPESAPGLSDDEEG